MAAKKKPVQTWSLADLGIDAARGRPGRAPGPPWTPPPRARRARQGKIVTDEGDGGAQLAEFLAAAEVHLTLRLTGYRRRRSRMAEILVLVDHVDGAVRKPTLELLTLARRLGEPSAVFVGRGADARARRSAEYGAAKVYVVDAREVDDYLVAPKAEALRRRSPGSGRRPPC